MATTFTSYFGMAKPGTGESSDSWGTLYNNNLDVIDDTIYDNVGDGECILQELSATQIRLFPCNGNRIRIQGTMRTIPDAGVTLTLSGMIADNNYYVYAWYNGGSIALELSLSAYSDSGLPGLKIKSGDTSRTLVGLIRSRSGTQLYDQAFRTDVVGLLSWFNRRRKRVYATGAHVSNTAVPAASSACYAFGWVGDTVTYHLEGHIVNTVGGAHNEAIGRINSTNTSWGGLWTTQVAGAYAPWGLYMQDKRTAETMYGYDFVYHVLAGSGTFGYVAYLTVMG